ncbi:MAG: hypothetical protein AKCLJLPJ_02037 [Fimbriimonadales bacterium]|nr:hypothetical protein [Fimbriimonadales bacterium]
MKRFGLAVACVLAAAGASAQNSGQAPLGLLVRAGFFYPSDTVAREEGKQWFTFGAELDLGKVPLISSASNLRYSVSVDTYSKGGFTGVPILLNFTSYSKDFHISFGVGAAAVDRPGFDDPMKLAYQVAIGWDFSTGPTGTTVELRWRSIANVASSLDGVGLTIGVRL